MESNLFKKALRRTTLALSTLALAALTVQGCALFGGNGDQRVVVKIHPIDKTDIFLVPVGTIVMFPGDDTFVVQAKSALMTMFYVEEVMNAQVSK